MKNGEKGPGRPHGAAGRGRGMAQRGAFGGQGTDGAALAVRPAAWGGPGRDPRRLCAGARLHARQRQRLAMEGQPPAARAGRAGHRRGHGICARFGRRPGRGRVRAPRRGGPRLRAHRGRGVAVGRAVLRHPPHRQRRAGARRAARLRGVEARGGCAHLRADTHADNAPMLRLLPALGFVRCGVVRVADGSPRIAFERLPQDGRA